MIKHPESSGPEAKRGLLLKINVDGCKYCSRVYVSPSNAQQLGLPNGEGGWFDMVDLTPYIKLNNAGRDIVVRVRGRKKGKTLGGQKVCDQCRVKMTPNFE